MILPRNSDLNNWSKEGMKNGDKEPCRKVLKEELIEEVDIEMPQI